mgnify:CR=1 FL=1
MFNFNKKNNNPNEIKAIISGNIIPLSQVNDPVFAKKMLGEGLAIEPNEEIVASPCDGIISMIYPTLHAIGIRTSNDIEILIHIGIDTVNLNGSGFKKYVNIGDHVKVGDKLIKFNSYELTKKNYDLTTIIIFPKCSKSISFLNNDVVVRGKTTIAIIND